MTKEKYKDYIKTTFNDVVDEIRGFHEFGNVLESLSNYINICIDMIKDIYYDKDIDYVSYLELNECINNNLKEVCRVVKNS